MANKKQITGRAIAIASVIWEILYIWLFKFNWTVTGICSIALIIGIIIGWAE